MTDDEVKMLDDILDNEDAGLSARAMDFIEDLDRHRERELSEKQHDWLESLHERAN